MATIGENLLGHRLEVVIKGERGAAVSGVPISVGLHSLVLDVVEDDRQPWHIAAGDVARWRLDCHCILTDLRYGWDCLELTAADRHLLQVLAGQTGVAA